MNRTLLFALLGLSLAGNFWLYFAPSAAAHAATARPASTGTALAPASDSAATRANAADATNAPASGAFAASAIEAPDGARRGLVWRTPKTDEDYRALANDLRAAGFPSRVIYTLVNDLYRAQALAESPLAKAPYWQRRAVDQSTPMVEFYRQLETKVAELAGPDGRLSVRLDAVARARRFGDLPAAKIDAIEQLERDYTEMQSDSFRTTGPGVFSSEEWAAKQKEQNLLKAEKRADLAKILTPEELATYDLRNSDAARQVASSLRNLDLRADEFAALYTARLTFEAASPQITGLFGPEQMQQRRAAQSAYTASVQRILNDDRFYQYLAATDADYRTAMSLGAKYPQVTAPVSYQVSQLKAEVESTRSTLLRSAPSPDAIQGAYTNWNSRLDTLLGPVAAAEFRRTPAGRVFNAPPARRTPSAASPVPPRG